MMSTANVQYPGQPMYGYNYQQQPGQYGYTMQPQQPIQLTNPLTKAQLELLKQKGDKLTLTLSELDIAKAICTHKDGNKIALVRLDPANPDRVTCRICGETFDLTNGDHAAVEAACELMTNIIQTIKTYWLDVPADVAQNLYTILPLIQRMPKIYDVAIKNFAQVENVNRMNEVNQPYGFNMFNNLMNPMFGMGMGGYYGGGYQQPMTYQQNPQQGQEVFPNPIGVPAPQQPMYQQSPMMPQYGAAPNPVSMPQPNYGAPAYQDPNMGGNPFGYDGAPVPQQPAAQAAPQQPAGAFQNAPQQAPAAVPAPSADTVNEKVFSV